MTDIFIVGSPRSGTSWLRTLLAGHPSLASPHELHLFERYLIPAERTWREETAALERRRAAGLSSAAGLVSLLDHDALQAWMCDLYRRARSAALALEPGATRLLEKTPNNARHLDLVRSLVPGARFVHLVRDPRDVVASMIEKSRRPLGEWAPDEVKRATASWLAHVGPALRDARPEDTLRVRYEDLRADPMKTLAALAEGLGLAGRVEQWLVGDPNARAFERTPASTVDRWGDHAGREATDAGAIAGALRAEIGAPTTRRLSRTGIWYVESRCAREMASLGYATSIWRPGRRQPVWALAAAIDLGARRIVRRSARRRTRRSAGR